MAQSTALKLQIEFAKRVTTLFVFEAPKSC